MVGSVTEPTNLAVKAEGAVTSEQASEENHQKLDAIMAAVGDDVDTDDDVEGDLGLSDLSDDDDNEKDLNY